jgi:hypothetical protein
MCFGDRFFPFSFRAEATSRGVQVKNDVPVRSSAKSRNLGHSHLGCGADRHPACRQSPAEGQRRDEILQARSTIKSLRLSNEGICYADKHMFLSLNQHLKNLYNPRIRARLYIFEAMQLLPDSAHVESVPKSIPKGSLRRDKPCVAQQSDASSRELSTM